MTGLDSYVQGAVEIAVVAGVTVLACVGKVSGDAALAVVASVGGWRVGGGATVLRQSVKKKPARRTSSASRKS